MREPEGALRPLETWPTQPDFVEFWPAGTLASGRFRCTACGNAADVKFVVPRCLMCGERLWEREESSGYVEVAGLLG
jgi:hypothetical protein